MSYGVTKSLIQFGAINGSRRKHILLLLHIFHMLDIILKSDLTAETIYTIRDTLINISESPISSFLGEKKATHVIYPLK